MLLYYWFEWFLNLWENFFGWPLDKPNLLYLAMWSAIGGIGALIYDLFFVYRIQEVLGKKYGILGYEKVEEVIIPDHIEIPDSEWEIIIAGLWCFSIIIFFLIKKKIYIFFLFTFSNFFVKFSYLNFYYLYNLMNFFSKIGNFLKCKIKGLKFKNVSKGVKSNFVKKIKKC